MDDLIASHMPSTEQNFTARIGGRQKNLILMVEFFFFQFFIKERLLVRSGGHSTDGFMTQPFGSQQEGGSKRKKKDLHFVKHLVQLLKSFVWICDRFIIKQVVKGS